MRLKPEQINRLAEMVFTALDRERLITVKTERGAVIAAMARAIAANVAAEGELERAAEKLLEETLRGLGSGAAGIDRHKMLRMIKDKLAKERKIVL